MIDAQTRKATIEERDDGNGWDMRFDDRVEFYASAAAARQALSHWDDLLVRKHGVSVVRILTWEPKTKIGRLVVKVLAGKQA